MIIEFIRNIFIIISMTSSLAFTGLLPQYDKRCDAMKCKEANIDPSSFPEQINYFNKEVPRKIHQIWFGSKSLLNERKCRQWDEYASELGYEYKLWTEKDFRNIKPFMRNKNYKLMKKMINLKNWWVASDILRYEILNEFGGVYVDCDFNPPNTKGVYVDLSILINFKGITLFTERSGRNINTSAIFVCNGFIISSSKHPLLISLIEQVYENTTHYYSIKRNYNAMFTSGPFFLNKVLSGCVNVVPRTYIKKFNCFE